MDEHEPIPKTDLRSKVYRFSFDTYVRLEAAKQGISAGELEKTLETETILTEFSKGEGRTLNIQHAIETVVSRYDAVTDFNLVPYRESELNIGARVDRVIILGTGIKRKQKNE
jgi:hypothetical protein